MLAVGRGASGGGGGNLADDNVGIDILDGAGLIGDTALFLVDIVAVAVGVAMVVAVIVAVFLVAVVVAVTTKNDKAE